MKQRLIIPVMALAMLLGSCSNEPTDDTRRVPGEKDCLVFDVESVETRGESTTTATIREFGVFCFDTGQSQWAAVETSATPNKLYNRQVVHSAGVWSYDPPVYWENYENKLHTFFAYSPMAKGMLIDHSDGNNIELIGAQATPGVPQLMFELLDNVSDHVDLLIAGQHLDLKPRDVVRMQFKHALTRIGFKAFSEVAGTYIEKIELSKIPNKGTLTMVSPAVWTVDASSSKDFTLDYGSGISILAAEANPIDISAPGRYLMAIPSKWTSNTTAKVKVYYRQEGVAINKEFLIGSTGEEWVQHRSITYVLDLNGKPNNDLIVDKVIIEEWKMGSITDSDVGLEGEDHWLRFDANSADVSNLPTDVELESGTLYKIPNVTPVKTGGATFKNWNTATDGSGTSYKMGERVPIDDADVTLYAQWN